MKQSVYSGAPYEKLAAYCRALRVGNSIEVAGTTALQNGKPYAPGDAYAQAAFILRTIQKTLKELKSDIADVVRTRIYVLDMADMESVSRAHREVFEGIDPVCTLVQVSALAQPGLCVEIEASAIVQNPIRLL